MESRLGIRSFPVDRFQLRVFDCRFEAEPSGLNGSSQMTVFLFEQTELAGDGLTLTRQAYISHAARFESLDYQQVIDTHCRYRHCRLAMQCAHT